MLLLTLRSSISARSALLFHGVFFDDIAKAELIFQYQSFVVAERYARESFDMKIHI